ncbi:ABC transporter permease [Acrocarpospora macrocephala]|uniref:ABC transporter permease n=1 Tax=Acrocarpospora macrocephala TaxID=150177 RepID=A0A5M3X803_9ACTN|nr:ABC transporter permease [Acrocarpospora macrocephala]GES15661.1 ABC transporter permease [Acrocarpospora macrocephala]
MLRYALGRILLAVPLLFGLSVLSFVYVRLIPGDPVTAMLGVNSNPTVVAQLREQFGLDRPLLGQYGDWLAGVMRGDFGVSFRSQLPISTIIVDRIPATLQLAGAGLVVSLLIAIPAGVAAGMRPGSRLDSLITSATLFGLAVPAFFLGTLLMLFFSLKLNLVPSQGYVPFADDPAQSLRLTVLPALTLGLAISPYLARLTRSAVLETAQEPFVPFARAKGLAPRKISIGYVLRNALPSLVAALGLTVASLMAGSIVVEALFNWPGTGRLVTGAVTERDYAMVEALLLIYGGLFIAVNLACEIAQSLLDPRVRLT